MHLSTVAKLLGTALTIQAGIIQNTQPPRLDSPAPLEAGQPATTTNSTLTEKPARNTRRRKRFDYEDTYEWEDDDDLTYELRHESISRVLEKSRNNKVYECMNSSYAVQNFIAPSSDSCRYTIFGRSYDEEEEGEPNLFQKLALHWRTAGPRLVFLGAFLLMVTLVCCSCLRLACRFWCKSMQDTSACCFLPGIKEMCQSCYTDPMYEKVRELGEAMGIEITYTTYEMIKDNYLPESDPMAMPMMM